MGRKCDPSEEKEANTRIYGATPGIKVPEGCLFFSFFFCESPPLLCTGVEFYDEEAGSTELKG